MSNKRTLKKQIRYICGDVAAECILAKHFIPGIDKDKINEALSRVAALQETAISRANVVFDKVPGDFANEAEYRKARKEYFAKAFKSLNKGFETELEVVVKEMNSAMPNKK